jgi:hypothetical protein
VLATATLAAAVEVAVVVAEHNEVDCSMTCLLSAAAVSRCSRLLTRHPNVHDAYAKAGKRVNLPAGCAMRFMKGGQFVPAVRPTHARR